MSKRIEIVMPDQRQQCANGDSNIIKYFIGGMVIMALIMKPQILAGVANALAAATEQPTQNQMFHQYPPNYSQYNQPPVRIETEVVKESIVDWDAREQIELIMNRMEALIAKVDGRPLHVSTTVPKAIAKNHPADKVTAFEAALREQAILEKRAQYYGDDPIVRERMGLSPKRLVNIEDFEWDGKVVGKVEIQ
jgi:hypothetical protein